jgi:hypothetical protein
MGPKEVPVTHLVPEASSEATLETPPDGAIYSTTPAGARLSSLAAVASAAAASGRPVYGTPQAEFAHDRWSSIGIGMCA